MNCVKESRRSLGCAYTLDRLVSDATPSMKLITHDVGTSEAIEHIQNMWHQLGGVGSRSLKWQNVQRTKLAQKILKRVLYAVMTGIIIMWTIQWMIWLGPHPFGERKLSQRAKNGVAFLISTTSNF